MMYALNLQCAVSYTCTYYVCHVEVVSHSKFRNNYNKSRNYESAIYKKMVSFRYVGKKAPMTRGRDAKSLFFVRSLNNFK